MSNSRACIIALAAALMTAVCQGAAEIAVAGVWSVIGDGSINPSSTNATDMETIHIGNPLLADNDKVVRIQIFNQGDQTLTLGPGTAVTFTGTHAADFSGNFPLSYITSIPPGGISEFGIVCTPSTLGVRSAVCHIASNDSDESDFDFAIQATAVAGVTPDQPEIGLAVPQIPMEVTEKATKNGPVYKIKGHFICFNAGKVPTTDPFAVLTFLSSDTFDNLADIGSPHKLKNVRNLRVALTESDYKLIKFKFRTTQNPYKGAVISVADFGNSVAEFHERNNHQAMMVDPLL